MKVDYKAIADGDPGGSLESAFASMQAETLTERKGKCSQTYISIASNVGFLEASILQKTVQSAVDSGRLPEWVDASLHKEGIDVNNPQTEGVLNSLVTAQFTTAMVGSILGLGVNSEPKYPNLKSGHLQNAREKRAAGEV